MVCSPARLALPCLVAFACHGATRTPPPDTTALATAWSAETLRTVAATLRVPSDMKRAIRPPDSWGRGVDRGNLYTEIASAPGEPYVPNLPLPVWLTWRVEAYEWTESVAGRPTRFWWYRERLADPDYFIAAAAWPLGAGQVLEVSVVSLDSSARRDLPAIVRSLRPIGRRPN